MGRLTRATSRQFVRARTVADLSRAVQELYDNQQRSVDTGVPIGAVVAWFGPENAEDLGVVPPGWLIPHGQILGQADFPKLYALIGDTFDGAGGVVVPTGSFRLPDLMGSFLQFTSTIAADNAGTVGSMSHDMDYSTTGGATIGRYFVLPLIRAS